MTESDALSRRSFIRSMVGGSMLYPAILSDLAATGSSYSDPLSPKQPHFPARAKQVIFIYMTGGVSHIDCWDPKPKLKEMADKNQKIPKQPTRVMPAFWDFQANPRCGTEVSDIFPFVRDTMDDICLIRSLHSDRSDHSQASLQTHTGSFTVPRPSIGSWVSYALGTENRSLPSFVVLAPKPPYNGPTSWNSNFLPPVHTGTQIIPGLEEPVPNTKPGIPDSVQQLELELLRKLNTKHHRQPASPLAEARIRSFEIAAGMQLEVPEVFDLSKESEATKRLYGLDLEHTHRFAWQCLMARRMVERGVRFVELIDVGVGGGGNWDHHQDMPQHAKLAHNVDQPLAGLIRDLKARGMFEDTLVVWTTEFGRGPVEQNKLGRNHYCKVYSSWLAGGGVKPGTVYGSSDELGMKPEENPVHLHDFHATILHILGFDHERLTYRHDGRDFRLTDVHGDVVKGVLA